MPKLKPNNSKYSLNIEVNIDAPYCYIGVGYIIGIRALEPCYLVRLKDSSIATYFYESELCPVSE